MENKERIIFLDYLRVTACFMVILVHSSENYYCSGLDTFLANGTDLLWVSIYDGFCRSCVPLFMVVSAYLLVPMKENQSWFSFYNKRFKRIVPPMFFFMVIYALLPLVWGGENVSTALERLYRVPLNFPDNAGHLWFLFPLLGIYLFIPFISPWLRQATKRQEEFFLVLWLISTCVPFINKLAGDVWGQCSWNPDDYLLTHFAGFMGYVVFAHYFKVHIHWSTGKRLGVGASLTLIGAVITILSFYNLAEVGTYIPTTVTEIGWSFCRINVVMLTAGMFLLFTTIQKAGPGYKGILDLSKLSYGMYLVHILWLGLWAGLVMPLLPTVAAIPTMAICTFTCAYLTIKAISYIPGSHWLIG